MCWNVMGDSKVLEKFYMQECEGNIGEVVEREEKLCDEVEAVS